MNVTGYSTDGRMSRPMKESQENQQNAETQRERYYATIHKVALQNAGNPEKIPGKLIKIFLYMWIFWIAFSTRSQICKWAWCLTETAEDISPYATFQLSEGTGGGLGGLAGLGALAGGPDHSGPGLHPNNTLLHSFMYHEHAMTEGCASPPPQTTVSFEVLHFILNFLHSPIQYTQSITFNLYS